MRNKSLNPYRLILAHLNSVLKIACKGDIKDVKILNLFEKIMIERSELNV
jgi:hypothetical protein